MSTAREKLSEMLGALFPDPKPATGREESHEDFLKFAEKLRADIGSKNPDLRISLTEAHLVAIGSGKDLTFKAGGHNIILRLRPVPPTSKL